MAFTTENEYTGNGSTTKYSFSFPYIIATDIKATIEDVNGNPIVTAFTLIDPTTVEFTSPPAAGRKVRIFRLTNVDNIQTAFFPGAAIRADDLNLNALQVLYAAQEVQERAVTTDGGVIEGDTVFVNADLVFEGSTDDDKETRLSVVDPTADQIYKLPNISTGGTHNLISDGDTGTVTSGMLEPSIVINGSLNGNANTATDLAAAAKVELSEHSAHVVNDASYFTTNASDARYFRQDTSETISSGDTWTGSDAYVATTGAIDNRIIDLVDDVGGFVPIANETSFPTSNPDVNNGAGTLISIKELSTTLSPTGGSVTIANGRGPGLAVIINGLGTTTLAAGFGAILETTVTAHTYTFHRLTPKATEVTTVANATPALTTVANDIANVNATGGSIANVNTVAGDIANVNTTAGNITNVNVVGDNISSVNAFSERYRLPQATANEYTTSLDVGDLYFNTTQNELRIYNGTSWQAGVTAGNSFMSLSGANAMNGPLQLENASDTELLPSLMFEGDPNTGLFQDQADTLSITTGGTERFKVENTGITVGTWNASTIATGKGGTGQTTYSNGELLIGNASGGLTKATLTATAPVTVTNADGSITIDVNNASTSADGLLSSTDKTKLDGIAANAEVNVDTNLGYTTSTRLLTSSTGTDVTLPEVAAGGDSGFMTGADKTKLDGIAANAEVNVATNLGYTTGTRALTSSTGTDVTLPEVSAGGDSGFMTGADKTKLDTIEANADVTDSTNVDAAGAVMNSDASTANMSFVIDEDAMGSDSATKVPTQQSVKAYVDDTNAAQNTTLNTAIAEKLPLVGGTMTGAIDMGTQKITSLGTPTANTDAATKGYTDTEVASVGTTASNALARSGGTMSGDINMGASKVTNLAAPTADADAATKKYVDDEVAALVDSSPGALDTLNELAAAINDDANFSTTVTNSIAGKLPLVGGTMSGNITFNSTQTFDGRDVSADGAVIDNLATVATSGSYNDLTNKPTIYSNSSVDLHLNQNIAGADQVLVWDGSDYDWSNVNADQALVSADTSRTSASYPVWTTSASGNSDQSLYNSNTIKFYPNTGTIEATTFTGALNGNAMNADTVDSLHASQFLRSDTNATLSGQLTVDNGTSTLLNVKCDNTGNAIVRAGGDGQGTGVFEVSQDNGNHGGGISYNGDGSPAFVSGETSDNVTFYRINQGTREEVFHYPFNSSVVNFNSTPTVTGSNEIWHEGNMGSGSGLDADKLDGAQPSVSASNSTIVQRNSSGYIYANYFNTNPNNVSSGVTKICCETGNDGFIRHATQAAVRTFIGAGSGNGLDADKLDGLQASSFLRSDTHSGNSLFRVASGAGNGMRFWSGSSSYSIYMSPSTDGTYGGRLDSNSDYNMYFKMTSGTNRGFVFMNGSTPKFQIESTGQFRSASNAIIGGNLTVNGTVNFDISQLTAI